MVYGSIVKSNGNGGAGSVVSYRIDCSWRRVDVRKAPTTFCGMKFGVSISGLSDWNGFLDASTRTPLRRDEPLNFKL